MVTPQRTALTTLQLAPTPMMLAEMTCVVETGIPQAPTR